MLRFGIFKTFPEYHNEASWNVGKEIVSIMMLILMIAVSNVIFSNIIFGFENNIGGFLGMLLAVLIIGIFPSNIRSDA